MDQDFKHWIKSFLTLNKYEQRGIVVLLVLLLFVAGINLLLPSLIHPKEYSNQAFQAEAARFQKARQHLEDSLHLIDLQNKKQLTTDLAKARLHPFAFDPNRLTKDQWLKLGLTEKQTRTILRYLEKGGHFRKKEDLKKMYCLSELEYSILAPYINLPETGKRSTRVLIPAPGSVQINTCDSALLCDKLHLQGWLAGRIIKYRNLLGNFYSVAQLQEVFGMKQKNYQKLKVYFSCDTSLVHRIDLNHVSFRTLLRHPYFDYQITRNLMNSRRSLKGFRSLTELQYVPGINDSIFRKIKHYLFLTPIDDNAF